MSFFEDASLVLIPSAQKTSKVYSVKPTDGTGDLTFTRSNDTATRVGPDGLIEKVRTNLALYSEDLTNAAWSNLSIIVGANATTAPNGTTTADKITPTTSNTNHLIYSNVITSAGEYSFSVYVKAAGYSKVALRESQSVGFFASFDLTSGTILDSSTSQTNTITSVGDGWYRITSTRSFSGSINLGLIPLLDSYTSGDPLAAYAGDGTSGIFAWGAQMEFDVPTDYIATTSAAVSVGPVANVPRLDYLGSSCPRLILEPQRQNVITFSEQMDNAAWTKSVNTAISANAAISPDGYQNADTITWSTSGGTTQLYQVKSTTGTSQTLSLFVKYISGSGTNFLFSIGTIVDASINLTFTNSGATLTGAVGVDVTSYKIEDYGNNWFRVSFSANYAGATSEFSVYRPSGTGTDVYAIYGAQLESNTSYATSYIGPTLGSAVTRGADACGKTGISSLIGQTEGTIFFEVDKTARTDNDYRVQLSDGTTNNWLFASVEVGNNVRIYCNVGGVNQFSVYGAVVTNGTHKIAMAYKANDFKVYVDGVAWITQTSGSVPTCSNYDISGSNPSLAADTDSRTAQALLFKTRLSNSSLAELTSL